MTPSSFAESLVAAFAASDAKAYFAHFHPDATFLFHDTPGLITSRADYEGLWTQWEREDGFRVLTCESTDQHVQEHGDLAVFTHAVRTRRLVAGHGGRAPRAGDDRAPPRRRQLDLRPRAPVSRPGLAITLDREEVAVGVLEPGDLAAAGAG